jgi:hypothetical protein
MFMINNNIDASVFLTVTKTIYRWGDRGVDGRIMLGWIVKKWDVGVRTRLGWLRIGIDGGRLRVR